MKQANLKLKFQQTKILNQLKNSKMIQHDHSTAIGTTTGTALSVFATLDSQDYMKTIVLACVGAVVSFTVTLFLKWIWKKFKS